jgi:hypothetical protein
MIAAFVWWFAFSALPFLLLMTGPTWQGRLVIGLVTLAASCGEDADSLEWCAEECDLAGAR